MSELTAHLDLPLDRHAPAFARAAVLSVLRTWRFEDPMWLDDATLIVSELVTNAFLHGGGALSLDLQAHEGTVTVGAADGNAVVPRRRAADEYGGRGLAMIESLAARWGVQPHEGGKRVWVQLRPYPDAAAGLGGRAGEREREGAAVPWTGLDGD